MMVYSDKDSQKHRGIEYYNTVRDTIGNRLTDEEIDKYIPMVYRQSYLGTAASYAAFIEIDKRLDDVSKRRIMKIAERIDYNVLCAICAIYYADYFHVGPVKDIDPININKVEDEEINNALRKVDMAMRVYEDFHNIHEEEFNNALRKVDITMRVYEEFYRFYEEENRFMDDETLNYLFYDEIRDIDIDILKDIHGDMECSDDEYREKIAGLYKEKVSELRSYLSVMGSKLFTRFISANFIK